MSRWSKRFYIIRVKNNYGGFDVYGSRGDFNTLKKAYQFIGTLNRKEQYPPSKKYYIDEIEPKSVSVITAKIASKRLIEEDDE